MKNITFKRPEEGKEYWYIGLCGNVEHVTENRTRGDSERFKQGNYYATQEYTEYKARVMKLQNSLQKLCVKSGKDKSDIKQLRQIYYNDFHDKVYFKDEIDVMDKGLEIRATDCQASQCIDTFEDEIKWYLTTEPPYLFEKDNSEKIADIEVKLSFVKNEEKKLNDKLSVMKVEEKKLNDRLKELDNE